MATASEGMASGVPRGSEFGVLFPFPLFFSFILREGLNMEEHRLPSNSRSSGFSLPYTGIKGVQLFLDLVRVAHRCFHLIKGHTKFACYTSIHTDVLYPLWYLLHAFKENVCE